MNCKIKLSDIFINTFILGILASFSHYAYQLSGENAIAGLFNPTNESVWEHLKFMFFPFILWWAAIFFLKRNNCIIPAKTAVFSAAISLIAAPLSVILLFYAYSGALGITSVAIDIPLVFICYFIALSFAAHLLKYTNPPKPFVYLAVFAIFALFAAFIVFTKTPPNLPIFTDFSAPSARY